MATLDEVLDLVTDELMRAEEIFPNKFNSAHEGFAILREEVDELWEAVKLKRETNDVRDAMQRLARIQTEAIQVAAMAIRLVRDSCLP